MQKFHRQVPVLFIGILFAFKNIIKLVCYRKLLWKWASLVNKTCLPLPACFSPQNNILENIFPIHFCQHIIAHACLSSKAVWVHPTALSYWLEVGIPEAASRQRWVNPDPGGQKGPQRRGEVIPCMLHGCSGSRALELAFCLWGNGGYCRIQPEKEKKKNFKCLLIILLIRVFCCILLTMQIKAGVCGAQKTSAHQRWGTKQNAPRAVLPLLCLQECMQGRSVLLCCTLLRCALHSPTHCCHF